MPQRASVGALVSLILVTVFAVFYVSLTWAPSAPRYDGSFGPFSNPMVVVSGLIVGALAAHLTGWARTGRLLLWVACGATVAMGVLAAGFAWNGPSPFGAASLFVLMTGVCAVPWTRASHLVLSAAIGVAFLVALYLLVSFTLYRVGLMGDLPDMIATPLIAAGLAGLGALAWRIEKPALDSAQGQTEAAAHAVAGSASGEQPEKSLMPLLSLLIAIIAPPIGVVFAHLLRRGRRTKASRQITFVALIVGYTSTVIWLLLALVIAAIVTGII